MFFTLLQATRWTHLPADGGWYDQRPSFVDRMYYILAEKSKVDAAEQRKRVAESKGGGRSGRVAGRRR